MLTYDEIINTPYQILEALSDEEINQVVETLFQHYRKAGFPYFEHDPEKIKKEIKALKRFDSKKIELPGNELQQYMAGLATCNMFHPEMYETKCNKAKSPMEIFQDDKLLKTALKKRIKYNDRNLTPSCIRRTLTAFGGQAASNFRPSVAKWVYEKFAGKNATVLDPCAGYGGRLMGAFCSSNVAVYHGVDPNFPTIEGNELLYSNLLYYNDKSEIPATAKLFRTPFEEYQTGQRYDLVFTSPPYFNVEKYSNDFSQSWVRYSTLESWKNGFLVPLIEKSFEYLLPGGYLVLNVGNPIVEITLEVGNRVFGEVNETYNMRLSKFLGKGNKGTVSHKTEPVFVWKKE